MNSNLPAATTMRPLMDWEKEANDNIKDFFKERHEDATEMAADESLREKTLDWMIHTDKYKYSYNFTWLGRPIIKYPQDILALQEIIWTIQPDLIIETGIAHGGSIILSASILELIGKGEVLAIDIDIRPHNREKIEAHPMFKRITMIEGSSVDSGIVNQVREKVQGKQTVMVILDSNHTHEHVLQELELYSPFVTVGSYLILPDTFIEYFPKGYYSNRPWDVGNNPMTALREFRANHLNFVPDSSIENKLLITEAFDGYLRRIY